MKLSRRIRLLILAVALFWLVAKSAGFLVIDNPQKSDAILVLAGETDRRPARGLELLNHGFAGHMILDVPANASIYGSTYLQLAQNWKDAQPQSASLSLCPIQGLSTKAEVHDAVACIRQTGAHSVLLVTSDYHTRRALSEFQKEIPDSTFCVAAAFDSTQFGPQWWRHRQWAKNNVDEWLRLLWWEAVDRWF